MAAFENQFLEHNTVLEHGISLRKRALVETTDSLSESAAVLRCAYANLFRRREDVDALLICKVVREDHMRVIAAVNRAERRLEDAQCALRLRTDGGLPRSVSLAAIGASRSKTLPTRTRPARCREQGDPETFTPVYLDVHEGIRLRVPTPTELKAHEQARQSSRRCAYGRSSGSCLRGRYAAISFRLGFRTGAARADQKWPRRKRPLYHSVRHADRYMVSTTVGV